MPKRRNETTLSSSSSDGEGYNTDGSSQSSINDPTLTVTRACSSTAAARQSQSAVKMSKRLSSKFVKQNEYIEGCLVMGRVEGYPFWPGTIRTPKPEEYAHHGYICLHNKKYWYCVQFFDEPTSWRWLTTKDLKVYDATSPAHHQCKDRNPAVAAKFVQAVKIIKAAVNYTLEKRLAKFTLGAGAVIDGLLAEIENGSTHRV